MVEKLSIVIDVLRLIAEPKAEKIGGPDVVSVFDEGIDLVAPSIGIGSKPVQKDDVLRSGSLLEVMDLASLPIPKGPIFPKLFQIGGILRLVVAGRNSEKG
jgi:hypothetical protein